MNLSFKCLLPETDTSAGRKALIDERLHLLMHYLNNYPSHHEKETCHINCIIPVWWINQHKRAGQLTGRSFKNRQSATAY